MQAFWAQAPVIFDERSGEVAFTIGECRLDTKDNLLTMTLTAPDSAQLSQLQDVIERHLVRFAFREELQINWRGPERLAVISFLL